MHGNPSGLDNTICTFGSLLKFRKGHAWSEIELCRPLHVLMINTGVDRSTATLVAKVAALREEFPELLCHLLDGMGSVVEDIVAVSAQFDGHTDNGTFNKLCVSRCYRLALTTLITSTNWNVWLPSTIIYYDQSECRMQDLSKYLRLANGMVLAVS